MTGIIDPYWFSGAALEPGAYTLHPIYIQHLPKTGTTTLFTSLNHAFAQQLSMIENANPGFPHYSINRFDDASWFQKDRIDGRYALSVSMHPYGFHERFEQKFELITVLRDPFRRVLSHYTYTCMRNAVLPTADEFISFYKLEENRNNMVKLLSGDALHTIATDNHVEKAQTHLTENFLLYGTTEHISEITSTVLRLNKLPNVLSDHLNNTEAIYLFDGTSFEDEIRSLNDHDQVLFDYVEANPRATMGDRLEPPSQHPLSLLIQQTSNAEFAKANVYATSTDNIAPHLVNNRCPKEVFDVFFMDTSAE